MLIENDPLWLELRDRIEHHGANLPRNLQRVIGPSEVGIDCDRCLGHKLAQSRKREGFSWRPFIGTVMHDALAGIFDGGVYTPEQRVSVGEIDGMEVNGSSDLYVLEDAAVVDWKVVGPTTLKGVRARGASQQYRTQLQLYGRGWARAGFRVDRVVICYLPRNAASLNDTLWWSEPYDEAVAVAALERATVLAVAGRTLGWDVVLPQLKRTPGCFDCPRYGPLPTDPKPGLDDVIRM